MYIKIYIYIYIVYVYVYMLYIYIYIKVIFVSIYIYIPANSIRVEIAFKTMLKLLSKMSHGSYTKYKLC